ncbi:MAG: hypothetical protein WCR21_06580 [Bacteroidota bacterium]
MKKEAKPIFNQLKFSNTLFALSYHKLLYLFALIYSLSSGFTCQAQSWDLNLNTINKPKFSKLGTLSDDPINFYTNGFERLTIGNDGSLRVNSFVGQNKRFLQTDEDGNIFPWLGDPNFSNYVLYGDGQWKLSPFSVNNNLIFFPNNTRIGIGTNAPETDLDVVGNIKVSNTVQIGKQINLGEGSQFASFRFSIGNSNMPNLLSFNVLNRKSGSTGLGNTDNNGVDDPDPLPDLSCLNGNISTVNSFNNVVSVFAPYNSTSVGNINVGHNGLNAFIETQGTNTTLQNGSVGNLLINSRCDRNVYFFSDNGNPFSTSQSKIMSVHGRFNLTDMMQIGNPSFTSFMEIASKLYVFASGVQDGVKVRHGGASGGAAFRAIELSDAEKGLSVFRGNQSSDGNEMFSVQGDGLTVISPINTKALSILKNNNETFSINKDGYTEIKVYSPTGMPNNRVLSVIDQSANRDLFAIKSNGKVYAREIEINLLQTFPDYVFADNYKLMSLNELDDFISKNKHLPGFESAKYYEKNGLNVNEMLVKQQEKIEELTLYIIQLEKKMNNH